MNGDLMEYRLFKLLSDADIIQWGQVNKVAKERAHRYFEKTKELTIDDSYSVDAMKIHQWPPLRFMKTITIKHVVLGPQENIGAFLRCDELERIEIYIKAPGPLRAVLLKISVLATVKGNARIIWSK